VRQFTAGPGGYAAALAWARQEAGGAGLAWAIEGTRHYGLGLPLPRPHKREYVFLTHAQLAALANASGRWRLLILVLGYTGLRRGEATALRACDVDLNRRRIDVRRAFTDVEASSSSAH
jgi:integrase